MILAFFIVLTTGCSKDSSDSVQPDEWITRCFTIVDSETGEPIEGALLKIEYNYFTTAATHYGAKSDVNGSMCGKIRSDARPYYWNVTKENYQTICNTNGGFPPETINMDYESYLKFEITNEEPYSEQDKIIVSYQNLGCVGQNYVRLNGSNIDTTLIRACGIFNPSWVSWESIGANPFTDQIQVNVNSRDTTVVNIVY
ncbi:hypothetical protein [Aestuariivivens marinum]|uniref:hypothetical protein n=1 Tax=Aestuariivivens marinum TaxID=2913555 RepID=UPI001F5A363B|nr:hypothetical protein [Aestuariivivens marinum]